MPWRFQMHARDEGATFSVMATFDARLHDPDVVRRMMRELCTASRVYGNKAGDTPL